jgi:DUF971 family protein
MTQAPPPRPVEIAPFPNGLVGIVWNDGHESYYESHTLRCSCGCASCVDENTGRKILVDETVPRDVRPLEFIPVGNYGVAIVWSDGHDTGIYTFDTLRRHCPCEACSSQR